jgi:hypothetical protein
VHLVLQPGALPDDVRPAQHLPPQRAGLRVGPPHRRQVVGGQQLRKIAASTLSVLTFASATARGLAGLATTTRPVMAASAARSSGGAWRTAAGVACPVPPGPKITTSRGHVHADGDASRGNAGLFCLNAHMLNARRIDGAVAALPSRWEMPSISSIVRSSE